MNFDLTKEQADCKEEFRSFVDTEVIPYAASFDKDEYMPKEMVQKLASRGYLGALLPKEAGGRAMDMVTIGILNEEIGRGCSSVRALLTVHGMVELAILRWGSQEQKDYWLPKMATGEIIGAFGLTEPDIGSDANNIQTTAVLDGEQYILNGNKKWITFGQIADVFLIFAKCDGKVTSLLVDRKTPGFTVKPIKGLMGARASMLAELHFSECRIPKENVVGQIGSGLRHVGLTCLDYGRYTIACGCVGLAQACLDQCLSYTKKRHQFDKALWHHELIQKMITEMVVSIKAARLIYYNAGYLKDIGDPDSIIETWNAKYFASKIVNKVAADAVQVHGANGCSNEYPVERFYRDAKLNEIIEGTTQIHEILISTNAIRHS